MSQYIFPDHLKYTKEHEWVDLSQEVAVVGITEYAVKSLHDIVYVSLPEIGSNIKQFQVVATVESIKSVSEIYSPLSGTIVDVNKILETNPEKINVSPYKEGWLFKIKPSNLSSDVKNLMSAEEYRRYIESLKK
ncbi:MAG: glycine cleavage system protein GcvH [Nitrososphaeria archaeon]